MTKPKNHRFLPIFYLKGWCDSSGQLIRYTRSYNNQIATKPVYPAQTGYEQYLYTMEGLPDDRKQIIEKDYMTAKVDTPAAKALRVLLDAGTSALTAEQRGDWTRFMIASLHRRPAAVAEIGETFKSTLQKNLLADSQYDSDDKQEPPPYLIDDAAKVMVVRAIENDGIGNIIINMQWSVLDMSASQHELLTGGMPYLRYHGLKDPRCTILFPLTPTKLFIATHDGKTEHNINSRSKTEVVKSVNDEVARLAERFVYGRTADHRRFVSNRLGRTLSR